MKTPRSLRSRSFLPIAAAGGFCALSLFAAPVSAVKAAAPRKPTPVLKKMRVVPVSGKALYQKHCQGCHGAHAQGVAGAGITLSHASHHSHAELSAIVMNGKKKMPAFKGKLTSQQVSAILKHVHHIAPKHSH